MRQLKAEQEGAERAEEETGPDGEEFRSVAREMLLDFATAVAGAEDRAEMVDLLASVDGYVDRVLEAS